MLENSEKFEQSEVFDPVKYSEKLRKLESFAVQKRFSPTKEISKDDDWVIARSSISQKLRKWFKIVFIVEETIADGAKRLRPFVIQEFDQYDKHACNKVIGEVVLPTCKIEGILMAGITVCTPPGTFGKIAFQVPRFSFSNPNKTVFSLIKDFEYSKFQRPDFNRLSGQVETKIVFADDKFMEGVDDKSEKIVWFEMAELVELLKDERMSDSISITLIQKLLSMKGDNY